MVSPCYRCCLLSKVLAGTSGSALPTAMAVAENISTPTLPSAAFEMSGAHTASHSRRVALGHYDRTRTELFSDGAEARRETAGEELPRSSPAVALPRRPRLRTGT